MRLLRSIQEHRERVGSMKQAVVDLAAPDIEWWAAGSRDILPWAGSWRGPDAVARWFDVLNGTLEYDT